MDGDNKSLCGWVKLFHPSGAQVTLPVPFAEPATMLGATGAYIAAGWLVNAPGLEAGENVEEIGWCVRKEKERDGDITPVLDLYVNKEGMTFSFLTVYLNTDEQVKGFESASGLKLSYMPLYEGSDKIERGKSVTTDRKVVKCKSPFKIVWTANPKWKQEEADAAKAGGKMYPVPRKKFVRFAGGTADVPRPSPEKGSDEPVDEEKVKAWEVMLSADPSYLDVNDAMPGFNSMNRPTKVMIWAKVKEYAIAAGWTWNEYEKKWFAPDRSESQDEEAIPF